MIRDASLSTYDGVEERAGSLGVLSREALCPDQLGSFKARNPLDIDSPASVLPCLLSNLPSLG